MISVNSSSFFPSSGVFCHSLHCVSHTTVKCLWDLLLKYNDVTNMTYLLFLSLRYTALSAAPARVSRHTDLWRTWGKLSAGISLLEISVCCLCMPRPRSGQAHTEQECGLSHWSRSRQWTWHGQVGHLSPISLFLMQKAANIGLIASVGIPLLPSGEIALFPNRSTNFSHSCQRFYLLIYMPP